MPQILSVTGWHLQSRKRRKTDANERSSCIYRATRYRYLLPQLSGKMASHSKGKRTDRNRAKICGRCDHGVDQKADADLIRELYEMVTNLDVLQLSDGEKCTLALFGDIARRLAIANPSLDDPLQGDGVVLIDELELHMHTSWQRKVISMLKKTFPNIQFIITTHSPQILGEVDHDFNVYALSRNGSDIQVVQTTGMFGMDSNSILEDKMETDSVSAIIKQKTEEMYSLLELKDFDGAENIADEIDELTQNRNIDTVRARVIIRRGRYKNNDLSNP